MKLAGLLSSDYVIIRVKMETTADKKGGGTCRDLSVDEAGGIVECSD
jgi:hypothetical protein